MTDLHFRLNCTNGQQQQNRTVILFIYIYPFTFFLPYYSYLELATVLCLHLNGILIDPPYLWDTFAAPSKRAREIDFVEVSEAKRYPSELIIVQNLHGTRTVGYLLLTHRQQQHQRMWFARKNSRIFAKQQGHAPVLNFILYSTQTHWPFAEPIAHWMLWRY